MSAKTPLNYGFSFGFVSFEAFSVSNLLQISAKLVDIIYAPTETLLSFDPISFCNRV